MAKSNIVTRVRFKKDVNFQRLVGGWSKYVSKDGADGKSLRDLSSVNDLYEKELGIYDSTKENEENYIFDKNGDVTKHDILKDIPKDKSGKMWTLVLSFPPKFAEDSGLRTKYDYYMMSKSVIPRLLLDNDFDLTNTKWYASLHRDTDNPHLHICIFEDEPRRKKDTLDKSSLKNLKSNIASYLVDNTSFYTEQDYILLGLENKVLKSNYTRIEKELMFSTKFRKKLNKDLLILYEKLPERGRLQYNSKNLDYCRKDIDKIIEKILYHDTIKYDFERYYHSLEEIQREQIKMYGNSKNSYVENKIKRLYSKIGNDILHNFKVYNSTNFLDREKEFLSVNLMNMNLVSRNIKKKSTIYNHAKEIYKLGKIASMSDSDIKRLLEKWAKKSNIKYDIDLLFTAVSSTNVDNVSVTDFYKALAHLGYTKYRYDSYKSKSFYKNLKFKQFINKANYYILEEIKKEEEFLAEILEKELQGRDL